MIIDSENCANVISTVAVEKLGLTTIKYPKPYRLEWLNDSGKIKVNKQVKVKFSIDNYVHVVSYDVAPMHTEHILLGRPWQFDKNTIHYGQENSIVVRFKGKKIKLKPLTPRKVFRDQMQMQQRKEAERQKGKAIMPLTTSTSIQDRKVKPNHSSKSSKPESEKTEKEKKKINFYLSQGEIKREFLNKKPMLIMLSKDAYLNHLANLEEPVFPSFVSSLLQEFNDIFPEEIPGGLSPIDFISGAAIPNRPAT
ncbi:uncharacterized protein LOC107411590 [Ziziphus jujuba]|uniref:Uncharacterized protein LOC107411590 n=1 Tax=Ziziphus jujuba TaxID=326968 RepID=A0ABM4A967_ZIZJJ|nr:uncharacterized protein LOC107411590 [Ziziphus jujuba]